MNPGIPLKEAIGDGSWGSFQFSFPSYRTSKFGTFKRGDGVRGTTRCHPPPTPRGQTSERFRALGAPAQWDLRLINFDLVDHIQIFVKSRVNWVQITLKTLIWEFYFNLWAAWDPDRLPQSIFAKLCFRLMCSSSFGALEFCTLCGAANSKVCLPTSIVAPKVEFPWSSLVASQLDLAFYDGFWIVQIRKVMILIFRTV